MKRTSTQIKKAIDARNPEKRNYTFRLEVEIMKDFKKKCELEAVSQADVIAELMKDYLST